MKQLAPIALFCYNRTHHLKRTVDSLLKNPEASESVIHFFSDAPKNSIDAPKVEEVRDYLKSVTGFREIIYHFANNNLGLSESIISGVSSILKNNECIIVLEDDMECVPFFLAYMNSALNKYSNYEEVISIHAYTYPISDLPPAFFLKGADCWGWGTWKRGWKIFEASSEKLILEIENRKLKYKFNFNGKYPFYRMLKRNRDGKNQSWAIRWYASALLSDKLTLYPGKSLIRNTGNDSSGTHVRKTALFESIMADIQPEFPEKIEESIIAYKAFVRFFARIRRNAILERLGLGQLIR